MIGGTEAMKSHKPVFSRKWLKNKILIELPWLKSVTPNIRKPSIIYCPDVCEASMVEQAINVNDNENMKVLYKAGQILRESLDKFFINKSNQNSTSVSSSQEDVLIELYSLIRWTIAGPQEHLENEAKAHVVNREALTLIQNIMFSYKSKRQVNYQPKDAKTTFRTPRVRENPQAVGLALTVHHKTRNRALLELLNTQGYCVSYNRTLRIETALANAVIRNMIQFKGLYVHPFVKKGLFVLFCNR